MGDIVIKVENLWKQYRYGTISHATLRKDFQSWWARMRGKSDPNLPVDYVPLTKNQERRTRNEGSEPDDSFWALRDVSFDVKQGEVLGIIGKNGAGKSTLLKIMSKVTSPTKGEIKIKGRIASLLEVGTGFHPELTGRENIFLNGAILGMSKTEIARKFDEIVTFAEVEKFIDTPVKRYSSGMYVRLAFAVAAHLEPEILIIDEVLAVGDAAFQQKCLGKMGDVAKEGRTVLFVSHNMGMISLLCSRVSIIDAGKLIVCGDAKETVRTYIEGSTSNHRSNAYLCPDPTDKEMYITEAETVTLSGKPVIAIGINDQIILKIGVKIKIWTHSVILGFAVKDQMGLKIFTSQIELIGPIERKENVIACVKLPVKLLTPGKYSFLIALHVPFVKIIDSIDEACAFTVTDTGSDMSIYGGQDFGCVYADCEWILE